MIEDVLHLLIGVAAVAIMGGVGVAFVVWIVKKVWKA